MPEFFTQRPWHAGLVVFDSVASMRKFSRERTTHTDYENSLFGLYGINARVIIQDGLRFLPYGRTSPRGTYEGVLQTLHDEAAFRRYDFVILVSAGNDVYEKGWAVTSELFEAIQGAAKVASYLSTGGVMVIFGASAATWRYRDEDEGRRYDQRVQQVLRWSQKNLKGAVLVSGAAELSSIEDDEVVDRIGHLKYPSAFKKLVAAVHAWHGILLQQQFLGKKRSKL